jgi:hypothetical protein
MPQPSDARPLLAVLAGCALFTLAAVYLVEPAGALPAFFPGHVGGRSPARGQHEIALGVTAFVLGAAAFTYGWIATRPNIREPHGL